MQCDFCSSQEPIICFVVQPASLVITEGDGKQTTVNSDSHWSACHICKQLIDMDYRESLARRAVTFLPFEVVYTIQHVLFWNSTPEVCGPPHTEPKSIQ